MAFLRSSPILLRGDCSPPLYAAARQRGLLVLATLSLFWLSCGSSPTVVECNCPPGQVCVDGVCQAAPCQPGECPLGFRCIDGTCQPDTCVNDEDCPPGHRCIEFGCYLYECDDGQIRDCWTECGAGTETCSGGVWRGCTAPTPRNEVCGDEVDNNCNGQVDEGCSGCTDGTERPCLTECGSGTEWCVSDSFKGCTAPTPLVEVCGDGLDNDCNGVIDDNCTGCTDGATRSCHTSCGAGTELCRDGAWRGCTAPDAFGEVCDGKDNDCDGKPDQNLVRDCSTACGPGFETCTGGMWSGCSAPVDCGCSDGAVDQQVCGQCGTRERSCVGQVWGFWGDCTETGICIPGQADPDDCGWCGSRNRYCTQQCDFGDWLVCRNEGECQPETSYTEACGDCVAEGNCDVGICEAGTSVTTCSSQCEWGSPGACSGDQGPEFDVCGDGIDQDCDGSDTRSPDNWEPNDTCESAYFLGLEPDNLAIFPTFDSVADKSDFFYFTGDDTTLDPTEKVQVWVDNIPPGHDYDIFLYRELAGCQMYTTIASSVTPGSVSEYLSFSEDVGGDEDGDYYIEVYRRTGASCTSAYKLTVHGLR